ncbi:hypothetical protein [Chryseolinea lacunae]|uniref:Uncharacterized protein n=1 Tax=Chryseolinea lacunae TaxID=2801331 RepID=A0ABS1KXK2_9BACT|nr:hypothetical protein [Chryseolinea lacunae]MBL0744065.1 hypothetical protein [Chryseolinea lacunae]
MKNEKRIIELLAEVLIKQDTMTGEIRGVRTELKDEIQDLRTELKYEIQDLRGEVHELRGEVYDLKYEVGGMKGELVKLNLQTAENTRAIVKLANEVEKLTDLPDRVSKLEKAIYR